MGEFMIRIAGKNECSSRLDVGGRAKHDKLYTGSSLVETEEGGENGLEKKPLIFLGYDEFELIVSLVKKPGKSVEKWFGVNDSIKASEDYDKIIAVFCAK